MEQYIPKSALVAEINRVLNSYDPNEITSGRYALVNLRDFLETLEVKEMNLDNFIKEEFNKYSRLDGYGQLSVSYNMAEFYSMIKRLINAQKGE